MTYKIAGTVNDSIVDGPGLRFTIFMQGCPYNCKGCHNPHTHDVNGGYEISEEELLGKIRENPMLTGITLSGGEPFLQAKKLVSLVKACRADGLHIMAYSGNLYEKLIEDPDCLELLKLVDILVDGPFVEEQKSLELKFKGSKNQRVIDVQKSLQENQVVLAEI